jgi:carbamoyltransferase
MQTHFEDMYLAYVEDAVRTSGSRDVVMAGGCVLNSVANGRMITEGVVDRGYFHPAASDDGTAAGAALFVLHTLRGARRSEPLHHAYLGSEWSDEAIEKAIVSSGMPFEKVTREALLEKASEALAKGRIMGWFHGREEWGPRALGNRSILCHPGWPDMKATLNARIKNREPFRPFAPAILAEKLGTCFQGSHEVPFMIVVYKVRPEWKERLAAITHEDGSGRVQTVRRDQNALYYDLIEAFERRTGTPVLLNTSFNENEPIVHTPEQAIDCFSRTRMDCLGIGSFWMEKPASAP